MASNCRLLAPRAAACRLEWGADALRARSHRGRRRCEIKVLRDVNAYRDSFAAAMDAARVDALVFPVWTLSCAPSTLDFLGKRYRLNIRVSAEELKPEPAPVIPIKSVAALGPEE